MCDAPARVVHIYKVDYTDLNGGFIARHMDGGFAGLTTEQLSELRLVEVGLSLVSTDGFPPRRASGKLPRLANVEVVDVAYTSSHARRTPSN